MTLRAQNHVASMTMTSGIFVAPADAAPVLADALVPADELALVKAPPLASAPAKVAAVIAFSPGYSSSGKYRPSASSVCNLSSFEKSMPIRISECARAVCAMRPVPVRLRLASFGCMRKMNFTPASMGGVTK